MASQQKKPKTKAGKLLELCDEGGPIHRAIATSGAASQFAQLDRQLNQKQRKEFKKRKKKQQKESPSADNDLEQRFKKRGLDREGFPPLGFEPDRD